MKTCEDRVNLANAALQKADYILIGGGAGLSDAAGLKYSGTRFTDYFSDFIQKYGLKDLYTSSFYQFDSEEERWAYWARHVVQNRYEMSATPLYQKILELMQEKQYFVITTNVEAQFLKAGFPADRIFAVQGDYGKLQCSKGCHNLLYDNEELMNQMLSETKDCKIPSYLVPKCPVCKGTMDINVHSTADFVRDKSWFDAEDRYYRFANKCRRKNTVYLELGVGFNTPSIIRFPFEQYTFENKRATLIRMNRDHPGGAEENTKSTIAFTEDMETVIDRIIEKRGNNDLAANH